MIQILLLNILNILIIFNNFIFYFICTKQFVSFTISNNTINKNSTKMSTATSIAIKVRSKNPPCERAKLGKGTEGIGIKGGFSDR